jgi:hypothetical protein
VKTITPKAPVSTAGGFYRSLETSRASVRASVEKPADAFRAASHVGCPVPSSSSAVSGHSDVMNNIVFEVARMPLTPKDLKDLGVSIVGHRRALRNAIADLRSNNTAERAPLLQAAPAAAMA